MPSTTRNAKLRSQVRWVPVPGYPGYLVSSDGRVMSPRRRHPCILRPSRGKDGYPMVGLGTGTHAGQIVKKVHTLVLTAFVGPRPPNLVARHLDGNKQNNRLENLVWGTQAENMADKLRHGIHNGRPRQSHCNLGHSLDWPNGVPKSTGGRRCRTCQKLNYQARQNGLPWPPVTKEESP